MSLYQALHFFHSTVNWKKYWIKKISPFLGKDTVENGSGIGANINYLLSSDRIQNLTCLEPNKKLFKKIKTQFNFFKKKKINKLNRKLTHLSKKKKFDCIIYADVLEHIKKDKNEILNASKYLKINGRLVILSPSHNFLFTKFDKNVGHFRRYNKKMMQNLKPKNIIIEKCFYLDSVGVFLSLINKIILQRNPSLQDITIWDKYIVPISKLIDLLTGFMFGKSIICIYKKIR